MKEIALQTRSHDELINITGQVQQSVSEAKIGDGICTVFVPHTTAGVTINENADPDVQRDLIAGLGRIAPEDSDYRHSEGNSPGHIKSSLVGVSLQVPIRGGRLALGQWQGIYFCEFDGPRSRRFLVDAR